MLPFINVFGFELPTYSLLSAIGFIVSAFVVVHLGKARSISADKSLFVLLFAVAGVFLGGHFLFALTNIKDIADLTQSGELSFQSLMPMVGGMVFYGGLMGALVAVLIFTKVDSSVDRKDAFDIFSVAAPLFHVFGRVGCFLAGCCYGIRSDFGIATYLNTSVAHYGISRFPVQLVEALVNLLIFVLVIILFKKKKLLGRLLFVYLGVYAPARFVLEFFRGDEIRGFLLGFSTSQIISLMIIAFLLVYFLMKVVFHKHKSC